MAHIKHYSALDLTNWGEKFYVLKEEYKDSEDEFEHDSKDQYRVLRLRSDGYTQQIYRDSEPFTEEYYPVQSSGAKFDFIPLFTIGAQNNDASVDEIPIGDIAHVNVGHYRNSADLEESSFIAGQSMLHIDIGETDIDAWKALNGETIELGSRRAIQTQKGRAELIQAKEQNIFTQMMEDKKDQMLALGAKLIEKRNPNETAAAAKIDATGENSVLSDIVTNVEEGIQRCIEWCGLFMGETAESEFTMNREFFPESVDPQIIMAAIQLNDRGIIGKTDLRTTARKAGMIDEERTDEDIESEVGQISPLE